MANILLILDFSVSKDQKIKVKGEKFLPCVSCVEIKSLLCDQIHLAGEKHPLVV